MTMRRREHNPNYPNQLPQKSIVDMTTSELIERYYELQNAEPDIKLVREQILAAIVISGIPLTLGLIKFIQIISRL